MRPSLRKISFQISCVALGLIFFFISIHYQISKAQSNNGTPTYSFGADPCATTGVPKSSVVINLTSATTTQLVALSAGKQIFVCGFSITMVGAAETLQFEYGTGASCGTGTTTLTGAFADGTASDIALSYGGASEAIFTAPSGNALCALTTGTVGIQGVLTYVQG